jgi:hypothetical protein
MVLMSNVFVKVEKCFRLVAALMLVLFLAACSKDGEAIEQPKYTDLSLRAIFVDMFRLKVVADETILTESLSASGAVNNIKVQYNNPQHRYRVYNVYGDVLLLDTMISYKPGFINGITFFQPVAGAKMVWVGPPVNEPLPEEGYLKLSIIYTFDPLPDSVKVVVENSVNGGDAYAPTDSFMLKKSEFSRYFSGRSTARKPDIKFYPVTGPRKLLASARGVHFTANPDFSVYLFSTSSAGDANSGYAIDPVKLY